MLQRSLYRAALSYSFQNYEYTMTFGLSMLIGTLSGSIVVAVLVAHLVYADMIVAHSKTLFIVSLVAVPVVYSVFGNITIATGLVSPDSFCGKILFVIYLLGLGFNATKPAFAQKQ